MFKKIIVPVDGSEPSWQALRCAAELGGKFDGELIIVHVIQPLYNAALLAIPVDSSVLASQMRDLKENAAVMMDSAKEQIAGFAGNVSMRVEIGHPAECIIKITEENGGDAIVMGSRGLSGIAQFVLGSVSDTVAHYAKVPVLIVKDDSKR